MSQYFTDAFEVSPKALKKYGAFNISLVADLPLFVDPFLIFNSRKRAYRQLHRDIVRYLEFLYDKAQAQSLTPGLVNAWYRFPEIKNNWLGFSATGNDGRGLGPKFARELHTNLAVLFEGLNKDHITRDVHLEKLCLVSNRVGRDNISDFTNNLIHRFLLDYTSAFAKQHIRPGFRKLVAIPKAQFNYDTETWAAERFDLPVYAGQHVLLTPRDLLTKEDTWINKGDLFEDFADIPDAIPNIELRAQISNYFRSLLPKRRDRKPITKAERDEAVRGTLRKFPALIDYYIKHKEDHGDAATHISEERVQLSEELFIVQARRLEEVLRTKTDFFKVERNSYDAALQRVLFLKDAIEHKGCQKIFYVNGQPLKREADLQVLYRLTWFATSMDISREVNDGRGPVDFKVSKGAKDKSLVEMKLATNTQLERNLANQTKVYSKASDAHRAIRVILFFTIAERRRVESILKKLKLVGDPSIVLIDARDDNKPSGSKA